MDVPTSQNQPGRMSHSQPQPRVGLCSVLGLGVLPEIYMAAVFKKDRVNQSLTRAMSPDDS